MSSTNEDLDSAAKYRRRAEELRQIAESVDDDKSRRTILQIAADYEKLALSRELADGIVRRSNGNGAAGRG